MNYLLLKNQKYRFKGSKKLKHILIQKPIPFKNSIILDIGASTGGFTYLLLTLGIKNIYSLDVGINQLYFKIKNNLCVISLENIHIMQILKIFFIKTPNITVIDLSFISLYKVLLFSLLYMNKKSRLYVLIKPQFEVKKRFIKKGIVLKKYAQKMAVQNIIYYTGIHLKTNIIKSYKSSLDNINKNIEYWFIFETM